MFKHNFSSKIEELLNKQVNRELSASYLYMTLYSHFSNTSVALHNIAKYFLKNSVEEREHALLLINYINKRGGNTTFTAIEIPTIDANMLTPKIAFETIYELEKLITDSLLNIHKEASSDPALADLIESTFLTEQYNSLEEIGNIITNISRCQTKFEIYLFDKEF